MADTGHVALGCGVALLGYFVYRDYARRSRPDFEPKLREKRHKEKLERQEMIRRLQAQQRAAAEAMMRAQGGGGGGGGGGPEEDMMMGGGPGGQQGEQTVPTHMVDQMLGQLVHLGKAYAERGDWEIAARKLRFVGKLIPQQGVLVAHGIFKQLGAPPEAHEILDKEINDMIGTQTTVQDLIVEIKAHPMPADSDAGGDIQVEEAD